MPKALFFNVPGHGHVTPTLPLVTELVRRGHSIVYFVTEGYRAAVEATGATFRAYPGMQDDYFTSRGLSGSVPQKVAHALITTSEAMLPELLDITRAEAPDYILFDGMCPWGYLVARILKLPAVASLALAPLTSPPPRAMLTMLPLFLPMVFRDFGKGMDANKRANALTKKYSLPPFGFAGIMNNMGDLSLSYTSDYFLPFADTVSNSVHFVGWTPYEYSSNSAVSFEQVGTRKLIYISLGTLNNDDIGFFRTCIEAFANTDYCAMITTGNRIAPDSFGTLPENVAIYGWLPQVQVLKRAALFISHGGLNSIHDSLYLGVPLLVIPQQLEQTLNGRRIMELGAGLALKKAQVSAQALRECATRLLTDPQFKIEANRVGDTLRSAGGAARAADEVEALLRKP